MIDEEMMEALETAEKTVKKIKMLQALEKLFLFLFVAANVAVTVSSSRAQTVVFYASEIPWLIAVCFYGGIKIRIVAVGEEKKEKRPSLAERLISRFRSQLISFASLAGFAAALLTAGANRRLALMIIAAYALRDLVHECKTEQITLLIEDVRNRQS